MEVSIRDRGVSPEAGVQTEAIQAVIDEVGQTGGRIVVPAGVYYTGTLWLHSNTELHLQAGAVFKGTNVPEDYPRRDLVEEGHAVSRRLGPRRLIGALNCENVAVTGLGTIDGDGGCAGLIKDKMGAEGHPQNLQFVNCRHVTVRDVTLRNAGSWSQVYHGCEKVRIEGIHVWNHGNATTDGLDIDGSRDVRITDCDIDSHDDSLVFKSTGPKPCRDILVTGCRLRSNCHAIKFGTESVGGFESISIRQCHISASTIPAPIPAFPDGRPANTAVALECTDGGTMRNIHIDGIYATHVFAPIFIKLGNRLDRRLDEANPPEGVLEDVVIQNLSARAEGFYASSVSGYPGNPVRRVRLANIQVTVAGGLPADLICQDVPENSSRYPEINMFTRDGDTHLPAYGLYARHVEGLDLDNVRFTPRAEDARAEIVEDQVTRI